MSPDKARTRRNQLLSMHRCGVSYQDIGRRFGITGSRARQLSIRAEREEREEQRIRELKDSPINERSSVDVLDICVRSKHVLCNLGIKTIGDLCKQTPVALLKSKNFGRLSLDELIRELIKHGFSLDASDDFVEGKKYDVELLRARIMVLEKRLAKARDFLFRLESKSSKLRRA